MKSYYNCVGEPGLLPTLCAAALLLAGGVAAIGQVTLDWQVVSTEAGRRLDIARQPLLAPAVAIHAPQADRLDRMLVADGRVAIVSFFYSRCSTLCSVLASQYQQMQQAIVQRGLQREVRLLNISFDPEDTPLVLAAYARRQHADAGIWRMASVDQASERRALLQALGVVVVRDAAGEYQHNAALHLFDQRGRLVRVLDADDTDAALAAALVLARQGPP